MKRFLGILLFLSFSIPGAELHADDASTDASLDMQFGTHAGFRQVFETLKVASANEDARSVAKVINYPLRVWTGGKKMTIKSRKAFIKNYAIIMRPSIVKAIANDNYGDLMVNAQGAMIGNGEVWISRRCVDKACSRSNVGVITIQEVHP